MSTVMQRKSLKNRAVETDLSYVLVAYKSKNGSWRGFVQPYDITIEADSKGKAIESLREMVESYEEGLKKYSYPPHLSIKHLSNEEDNEVFNQLALKSISEKGKLEKANFYAEAKTVSA
jgi:hypothetical protein